MSIKTTLDPVLSFLSLHPESTFSHLRERKSRLVTGSNVRRPNVHSETQILVSKYHFPLKELGLLVGTVDSRAKKVHDKYGTSIVPDSTELSKHDMDTSKEHGRWLEGVLFGQV